MHEAAIKRHALIVADLLHFSLGSCHPEICHCNIKLEWLNGWYLALNLIYGNLWGLLQAAASRAQADAVQGQLAQSRAEASALREQLAAASAACEAERQARLAASGEVQVRPGGHAGLSPHALRARCCTAYGV